MACLCAASPACSICITCCLLAAPIAAAVSPVITAAHAPRRLRQVVCFMIYRLWIIKKSAKAYSAWARADCAGECAFIKNGSNPHMTTSQIRTGNQQRITITTRPKGYPPKSDACAPRNHGTRGLLLGYEQPIASRALDAALVFFLPS